MLKCSVSYLEMRRQKLKHTWQLTSRLLQIIDGRLLTGSTNLIKMMVEVASGKSHAMALINVRISAHDFSVHAFVATLTVAVLAVGLCDT